MSKQSSARLALVLSAKAYHMILLKESNGHHSPQTKCFDTHYGLVAG
jgi:hypothetical protein